MQNLRIPRLIYIAVWIVSALTALLFELDIFAAGFLSSSDESTKYAISLICVGLTLIGTWGALRIFALKNVRREILQAPHALSKYNLIRTGIYFLVIVSDLVAYYANFQMSQLYCLLISLIGFLFCWPKHNEVQ